MTPMCVVLTTAGSSEEGKKIAHALVERRLASCVNIVPRIESVGWHPMALTLIGNSH